MRKVFFGLEIPAEIKDRLLQVRAELAGASWQTVEQMHLTLLFLGNMEKERLLAVCEAARDISLATFEVNVASLGYFGQPHAAKHLWAGVQPQAPVISLHSAIKSQMERLAIETERRAYCPHITLARFKPALGSVECLLAEHSETLFGSFQVDQFVLFETQQCSGGSVYTVLERFPVRRTEV